MAKNTKNNDEQQSTEVKVCADENNCDIDKTLSVLSDLYKNVTMAQNAVKTLLPYVEDGEMTKTLHSQVETYDKYIEQIGTLAETLNFDPTPAPNFALGMAGMGIRMKMMTDRSTSHIAKIMLQGTLNGMIELYRLAKLSDVVHPEVALFTRRLLKYEEGRFEEMKSRL